MKQNWTNNPTKKQVVLFSIAWLVTLILVILVITNYLSESISIKQNPALCFLFVIGSFGMIRVCINYYNK
jgi:hypothetical protein